MGNPEEEQRALEHAGIALRGEIFGTVQSRADDVEHLRRLARLHPLRLAVVESAKFYADWSRGENLGGDPWLDLCKSVDALLAAEKESVT